jgi:hypothetical protein
MRYHSSWSLGVIRGKVLVVKSTFLMFAMTVVLVSAVAQQQLKQITDPAEYNTFFTAVPISNSGQPLETFLQRFPKSVVKEEALDRLMAVYQRLEDAAKMADAANRLLEVNPNNVRALALLASLKNTEAKSARDAEKAAQLRHDAAEIAKRGLKALPRMRRLALVSDDDYGKLIENAKSIFDALVSAAASSAPDLPPVFIPQLQLPRVL